MKIKAPRGTFDILPGESEKWQQLEKVMKETAGRYGYAEVRTPIFEHTELFTRSVGDSTDIVSKEMYTFFDRAHRSLTLRPEGTASCVRALVEHNVYSTGLPVKWYYLGPMFRYDRPQSGRYRQFHQFGIEAFGSDSPYLDAEIILLLQEILDRLGLAEVELHTNTLGCAACRQPYQEALLQYLQQVRERLCRDCTNRYHLNPLRVLDCKNEDCQELVAAAPVLGDYTCDTCRENYGLIQSILHESGVSYQHDDRLVRGLDYYTNIAFEVHIPGIGAQSAVGGGGRYNRLVKECGGPDLPATGFALGLERLLIALQQQKTLPTGTALDVLVVNIDAACEGHAFRLLTSLRRSGIKADKDFTGRTAKAQMKMANKLGARLVLIIGEDEVRGDYITLRDMGSKEQFSIKQGELTGELQKRLAAAGPGAAKT